MISIKKHCLYQHDCLKSRHFVTFIVIYLFVLSARIIYLNIIIYICHENIVINF
jgi:hypothetical protein